MVMEYSQEQVNYFRLCYVAFNLVPVGLRQIFKNEWDFRYKTVPLAEWKDTPQNGRDFYNNESKASRKKNARCLATILNGDTAEWDCTCLFFAILYSDSIGTTLSPAVYKDVDDIRQVRNKIAYITKANVADADYQTSVDRVLNAFTSLGLDITEIQEIKKQTTFPTKELEKIKKQARDLQAELDQTKSNLQLKESRLQSTETDLSSAKEENKALTQEASSKLQPFCILTSRPPHNIIRRSHDMARITNKMEELYSGANGAVSTVYFSGNPGCGKSQLAREIGQQFFSERSEDNEDLIFVATLNTENVETLAESYITLGRQLGITEYALTSLESLKREKPIEAIQQLKCLIFPKVCNFTKWLLIADNVIDLRLVRGLLPQSGSKEWGHGQVLITTQDSATIPHNAPHTYHESLSKGMRKDEAIELLETVSKMPEQDQAESIAELLDFQPLALAAAAYYMQTVMNSGSSSYDWRAYLQDISTYGQRNMTDNVFATESSAYAKTTMAAVEMAVQRAVDADEVLRQTFDFLALCAPGSLPLDTVLKFVKVYVKDQSEELMMSKVVRSSLVVVHFEEWNKQTYVSLHKIVHAAFERGEIFELKSRESDHKIAQAVKIFKSLWEENNENYAFLEKLIPSCESLLRKMTSDFTSDESLLKRVTPFIKLETVIDWLGTVASVSHKMSNFLFARKVADLAYVLMKSIDDTDRGLLIKERIFNTIGLVYFHIGQYSLAKELNENALTIRRKIFGEEHVDVAASYNNLALVYSHLGEYIEAKNFSRKSTGDSEKDFW